MKRKTRPRTPRDLIKLPVSTSIAQLYLHKLEKLAEASKTSFAGYVRLVLMDHVDNQP